MNVSIRVWRGLKFNTAYAAKLEKKKVEEAERLARKVADEARKNVEEKNRRVNPFSVRTMIPLFLRGSSVHSFRSTIGVQLSTGTSNQVSGLGTQLFGSDPPSDSEDEGREDTIETVTEQLASVTLKSSTLPSEWSSSPAYKPVYLSTISEYIPSAVESHIEREGFFDEDVDNKNASKDKELEGWETSADVDPIFSKFVTRVSNENTQCVRCVFKL